MKYDIVLQEIGEFGPYQKGVLFLLCLTYLSTGMHVYLSVYHTATPAFRCALPNYPNDTYEVQSTVHEALINHSIPWIYKDQTQNAHYDSCHIYNTSCSKDTCGNDSCSENRTHGSHDNNMREDGTVESPNENLPSDVSGSNNTQVCEAWVYDRASGMTRSVTTDMNIVCGNQVWRTHMKMSYFSGSLVGALVIGTASDRYGRKKLVVFSCLLQFASGLGNAFVTNHVTYSICRFFNGAASAGILGVAFVMGLEQVGVSKRMWAAGVINVFFGLGALLMASVAYFVRDWVTLQMALSLPLGFFVFYWWVLPESARWLNAQGRKHEALAILKRIAKSNKKQLSGDMELEDETKQLHKARIWHLCSTKTLVLRSVILIITWIVVSGTYYGLSLGSDRLHENLFLSGFLNDLVEIPGFLFSLMFMDILGRKKLLMSVMFVGGVANICTLFTDMFGRGGVEMKWVTISLALLGKICATAAFVIIYLVTAELYPTMLRNGAMGMGSMAARMGGMVAPYLADISLLSDIGPRIPYVIFGVANVSVGVMWLLLPETRDTPMPDTIAEARLLGHTTPDKVKSKMEMMPIQEDLNVPSSIEDGILKLAYT